MITRFNCKSQSLKTETGFLPSQKSDPDNHRKTAKLFFCVNELPLSHTMLTDQPFISSVRG